MNGQTGGGCEGNEEGATGGKEERERKRETQKQKETETEGSTEEAKTRWSKSE